MRHTFVPPRGTTAQPAPSLATRKIERTAMNFRHTQGALSAFAAVAGLLFAAPGHAAFVTSTTASAAGFNTNTTIEFDELNLAENTVVTNQYSGVSFSPNMFQKPECSGYAHMTNPCIGNFSGSGASQVLVNPFTIVFSSSQTQAGFNMATNDGTSLFEALLNGTVVGSASAATILGNDKDSELNFFGFEGITFDSIRVTVNATNSSVPDAALIDNLTFNSSSNPVPEPGSLALAGLALSSLMVAARWRRQGR
jgi:PEP-CTERM motif